MGINQLGWRGSEVVTVNLRVPDDKKTNPEVVHMWNSDLLMNLPDRQAKVRKTYDPFILTGIKLYTMVLYLCTLGLFIPAESQSGTHPL